MQKGYWPLLIVVLVALIAYAFVLLAQAQPGGVGGGYAYYTPAVGTDGAGALNPGLRISLSADRAIGGQAVAVDILAGDCAQGGALEVVHNGQVVARNLTLGGDTLSVPLVAQNGDNLVQVSGAGCSANLEFMAGPAECAVGANRTCPMPNNCPGVQACQGGLWSDCQSLEHICRPGRQVPCDLDACSFGVSICNSCGTGWGPCVAPQ
ncbi:MAG: hypothetical protein V1728_03875 [Candidatus Micrarchaeota archaeon]